MRRFMVNALSGLLVVVLVAGLASYALFQTVHGPGKIEQALDRSGAYAAVAPSLLEEYGSRKIAGVSISDPAIRTAATQAFSARYVAATLHPAIQDSYTWLNGDKTAPTFTIDYTSGANRLRNRVADVFADRVNDKPTCSLEQLLRLGLTTLQSPTVLGNVPCIPPAVQRNDIQTLAAQYIGHSPYQPPLLKKTSYQAKEVTLHGQPFYESAAMKQIAPFYRLRGVLPWLLLALAALLLGLIAWVNQNRRKVLTRLSVALILSGLISSVGALSIHPFVQHGVNRWANDAHSYHLLMSRLANAASLLANEAANGLKRGGIFMILIGAVLLVLLEWRTLRKRSDLSH